MTKKLKLNKELGGLPSGSIVPVSVDNDGIPTSRYWRERLEDAKMDKCCEFVKEAAPSMPKYINKPKNGDKK